MVFIRLISISLFQPYGIKRISVNAPTADVAILKKRNCLSAFILFLFFLVCHAKNVTNGVDVQVLLCMKCVKS